jgi:hypothetical protein
MITMAYWLTSYQLFKYYDTVYITHTPRGDKTRGFLASERRDSNRVQCPNETEEWLRDLRFGNMAALRQVCAYLSAFDPPPLATPTSHEVTILL